MRELEEDRRAVCPLRGCHVCASHSHTRARMLQNIELVCERIRAKHNHVRTLCNVRLYSTAERLSQCACDARRARLTRAQA